MAPQRRHARRSAVDHARGRRATPRGGASTPRAASPAWATDSLCQCGCVAPPVPPVTEARGSGTCRERGAEERRRRVSKQRMLVLHNVSSSQ